MCISGLGLFVLGSDCYAPVRNFALVFVDLHNCYTREVVTPKRILVQMVADCTLALCICILDLKLVSLTMRIWVGTSWHLWLDLRIEYNWEKFWICRSHLRYKHGWLRF
eukprot:gene3163-2145_t